MVLPPSHNIETYDRIEHFIIQQNWTGNISKFVVLKSITSDIRLLYY